MTVNSKIRRVSHPFRRITERVKTRVRGKVFPFSGDGKGVTEKEFWNSLPTHCAGFITLEIMLALAVMMCTLSAIILLSFGGQSILADNQINTDALSRAEAMLEQAKATARKDFKLLNATTTSDSRYASTLAVSSPDFFKKEIAATVSWDSDTPRPQHVTLRELVTDFDNFGNDDTCDSDLSGDWSHPHVANTTTDFATLASDPTHTYSMSDIDAYLGRLYVTADKTTSATDPTFFIFDISDPTNPHLLGKLDNAPTISSGGISTIALASSSTGSFAYVGNGTQSNFSTCTPGKNCAQLQVIDVSSPATPTLVANFEIPTSTAPFVVGSGGKAVPQSIFYKNGYVYLGLSKTASGPEFNVIDMHDPLHPKWVGGYAVGYTINAIVVRNNYAYLAHTTDASAGTQEQLTVLDVSDPTHPFRVSGFFDTPGIRNIGKTVTLVGDTLYLGREASQISPFAPTDTIPEFYILDSTHPTSLPHTALGTTSLATMESLHNIIVRDTLAFFVTTSQFQIWNISSSSRPTFSTSLSLPTTGSTTPSFDCEKNIFYVASNNASNRGFISIITSQ